MLLANHTEGNYYCMHAHTYLFIFESCTVSNSHWKEKNHFFEWNSFCASTLSTFSSIHLIKYFSFFFRLLVSINLIGRATIFVLHAIFHIRYFSYLEMGSNYWGAEYVKYCRCWSHSWNFAVATPQVCMMTLDPKTL